MKLSKCLLGIALITIFSLVFVWQQTEIFRLAYEGQKIESELNISLDRNSILRYNLKTNTSLTRIYGKISTSEEFHLPDAYMLVKLNSPARGSRFANRPMLVKEENMFSRIFGLNRTAEARTVNSAGTSPTRIITITTSR